ncbi:tyrosine-type recombinase/integrase [Urbifossiella limnaea]|uniref:Site-specific tyrosine recombinase XerC n=1 Tax=Urbifossiella limnaea TaxID=2528023 RepID=A0A517XWB8_9BACT|nr:tyrosine-type recombinase/integrase [Urbifossiella limnaea]QDU21805.1 site-specific tyrosine recombinase XerC [Urbifossiella limnaea]
MAKARSFRVGKVTGYLRGRVWYLCYFEHGKRRRPRAGADRDAARQLAAQVNAQLETGAPSALGFEPIGIPALRRDWLDHHEQVRRSSVQSINRYRTATEHLLRFLSDHPLRHAGMFSASHAADFVRHLRAARVSPNGHPNTPTRPLLDKGVRYVLECCRALFNHAARRRHLPPYAGNPFAAVEIDRIPVESARPITLLTADQEREFLGACDDWQFPVFLTLILTGLRPGELCHLLLPDDLDLAAGLVRVRNKPRLGWQVKTRNQRDMPLVPALADVLRVHLAGRTSGPVFLRRTWTADGPRFDASSPAALEAELSRRLASRDATRGESDRDVRRRLARRLWRDAGAVDEGRVRVEFIRAAGAAGLAGQTAPKVLRHQFATALQEGRVDPLVRNILMGHAAAGVRSAGHGLGMTAVYTHTRPETVREQLLAALADRAAAAAAREWVSRHNQLLV